jgi:hypothetical protein
MQPADPEARDIRRDRNARVQSEWRRQSPRSGVPLLLVMMQPPAASEFGDSMFWG